ncbi:PREDICTED: alpha-1,3-mannosyl-glycoprotein 4-beta-N-acetylglucosaminyltransferase B [Galeopterus variegatus]|nr:PREDICTED: alpha-1,3-mannosyl-glycoprotein 4-beta-N-acetylglucosaminyltransferase B [Galeopterus variegatus]
MRTYQQGGRCTLRGRSRTRLRARLLLYAARSACLRPCYCQEEDAPCALVPPIAGWMSVGVASSTSKGQVSKGCPGSVWPQPLALGEAQCGEIERQAIEVHQGGSTWLLSSIPLSCLGLPLLFSWDLALWPSARAVEVDSSRVAGTRTDVDGLLHRWVLSRVRGVHKRGGRTALGPPPLVTACLPPSGDVVDVYQREFLALRDRLHAAEQESLKRSKELNLVLDEIKRAVSERQALRDGDGDGNRTWSRLTGAGTARGERLGAGWPPAPGRASPLCAPVVSVVMGIPSVRREVHSYLTDTLHSLISELSPQEKEDSVIVVLIAETDPQYTSAVTENIKALFPTEIHSGLLEVISPSPNFYPDFSRLRESFGDPKERVRWRTKQNLDYCFLMMYAQSKGIYYVQLEDDIVAKPNYLSTMKNFALQQPSEDWMILEFSQLGFIGKMFKSLDLSLIVEFILMFYRDKPIDWLLDHILWVKVCNPEKDAKHCDRQKANLRIRFKPSLFQHVGTHSSLAGKIQKLKDKDFGKQALRKEHVNPPAEVSTSLKTYQHFTLEKAYLREDFFWAFTPAAGDFIRFRFFQPLRLERFFFRSGNIEHPEDKLFNTSVEVLPFDNPQSDKEALQEGRSATLRYPRSPDGYLQIGSFYKGVAEGEVDPAFGPLEALRLSIQTDSPVWVILSEIFLKKAD